MLLRQQLLTPLSKWSIDTLVSEILLHPEEFEGLYQLIFDTNVTVAWRAAWACQKISIKEPNWFQENHFNALSQLTLTTSHGGIQRGCLAILYNVPMPSEIDVDLLNACFDWMLSPRSAIAVQAYSMKMAFRFCKLEPDLASELRMILQEVNTADYSPGFNSTRTNILKALSNC